ncbi:unnamed protein product [Microthlaspi erraticum]|uniref:B30.2/SPRY domain-containing protein n=1 Tax=Microthlaspi erraticum TaxID=1685480 RepID=A0A6D2L9X8_9BRAS|nr:unnamed protein product [Microthlaspi erraticum]
MDSYFSDLYRLSAKRNATDHEEEQLPRKLTTVSSSGGSTVISADKLSVKYSGRSLHDYDAGVSQSEVPAPTNCLAYYFEVHVNNAGDKGKIAIGFIAKDTEIVTRTGWEENSCSYHGDDGFIYRGGINYANITSETFTTSDTVGGGINYASEEIFFTKNGALVGTIPKVFTGPLFPTVAVHSQNEEVTVNFGSEMFAFDIKNYEASERKKQQMEFEKIIIPRGQSHMLVRNYLSHYGYEETLKAFNMATETSVPRNALEEKDASFSLQDRKHLRELIMKGEIVAAIAKLQDCYPELLQNDKSEVCFLLHCQKFIELVRIGELEEAVKYGRVELAKFIGLNVLTDIVQDCFALLAYKNPEESSVAYLLGETQKEVVADAVNAMVLSTNENIIEYELLSRLERLLRQLSTCSLLLRTLYNRQGEVFSLHRFLNNNV